MTDLVISRGVLELADKGGYLLALHLLAKENNAVLAFTTHPVSKLTSLRWDGVLYLGHSQADVAEKIIRKLCQPLSSTMFRYSYVNLGASHA